MFEIPTINATQLGWSGFGDTCAVCTVGVCHPRMGYERNVLAVFLETNNGKLQVRVAFTLMGHEADADDTDDTNLRTYSYDCEGTDAVSPVLQGLGRINSLKEILQGKTAAEIDRVLRRSWGFERECA